MNDGKLMNLDIRSINDEDIDIIYGLTIDLVEEYEDLASIDYPKVRKWLRNKIISCQNEYRAIYCQDRKVGYFHLSSSEGMQELDDFHILKKYQGKGIGTALIKDITGKYPAVFLYVFKKNTRAIALYERLGCRITREYRTRLIMEYHGQ